MGRKKQIFFGSLDLRKALAFVPPFHGNNELDLREKYLLDTSLSIYHKDKR